MAESIEKLGFLSPEIEQFRRDQRLRLKSEFEKVESTVAIAMADLHGVGGQRTPPTWLD